MSLSVTYFHRPLDGVSRGRVVLRRLVRGAAPARCPRRSEGRLARGHDRASMHGATVDTGRVGTDPTGLAIDRNHNTTYVTNFQDDTVAPQRHSLDGD
jgi:hypothetical protein